MGEAGLLPGYIPREREQREIQEAAALVRGDRQSRVVLLYGPGGVGKTVLVRRLVEAGAVDERIAWLQPIDVDDPEYWLLPNLERKVAEELDPEHRYFDRYLEYLSQLPRYMRPRVGQETVRSHLGRVRRVFQHCYERLVSDSGKAAVITLDTVEAIRGMNVLRTLTQWMKELPATLFVLSGRPPAKDGDRGDEIAALLEDPQGRLRVRSIHLGGFTHEAARRYLDESAIAADLSDDAKETLVHLTRGHPLWLALTTDYLTNYGMPEEAEGQDLAWLKAQIPDAGALGLGGAALQEAFKRRLVTPYQAADFEHEAIKRLAVVRQSVNLPIWRGLMDDCSLPEGTTSWEQAWDSLLRIAWIRPRANRRYVTLHDALAEELAQRIIPLHDQDKTWRRRQWRRAVGIYAELTERPEEELQRQTEELDRRLQQAVLREPSPAQERELIDAVTQLDTRKGELDQLKAARLFYQILVDPDGGCRQFLDLFDRATSKHDVLFRELICLEMQRFLPNGVQLDPLGDVIRNEIDEFHRWLSEQQPGSHIEIGLDIARYLNESEQPRAAVELLEHLPVAHANLDQQHLLSTQLGNAWMRIPGEARAAERHFQDALAHATALESPERERRQAKAYKELGFYYRNLGFWPKADESYEQAHDAISAIMSPESPQRDREEWASIQTNWAYVKALRGQYFEAKNLVESAIAVRRHIGRTKGVGQSLSVLGELYRYGRQFQLAWDCYADAERIFQQLDDWPWLGLVYQEQAICLFEATQEGASLDLEGAPLATDLSEEAERRILRALDLCRDLAFRAYPSALNRAGRIFGATDPQQGLRYLEEGVETATQVADGWFWYANMVEYAELSYRLWARTRQADHRQQIHRYASTIDRAKQDYEFPDLEGRWKLLQGHLGIQDWLETHEERRLDEALQHYKDGFLLISEGYLGSHGIAAIPIEFKRFGDLYQRLPRDIHERWYPELRHAWKQKTSLLARLEEARLEEEPVTQNP
jgi:tetratricopeptide (TPR) repeat protein